MPDQLGLEQTPDEYISNLVAVFRECKRILRDDGTLWVNIGDSYASVHTGGHKSDKSTVGANQPGIQEIKQSKGKPQSYGLKDKDLMGVPWMLAFALRADGWYLRSDIIWAKPNPMPESVTDRPTKSHEYLFLLSKSAQYYYDAEAIAEPVRQGEMANGFRGGAYVKGSTFDNSNGGRRTSKGNYKVPSGWDTAQGSHGAYHRDGRRGFKTKEQISDNQHHGSDIPTRTTRNKRSVWTIATQATSMAHFATFPEKLVEPCVLAGSRVGDIVLDPFAGSGTVERVCTRLNRKSIGLELNFKYISEIASVRTSNIQPFLVLSGADGKVE